MAEKNAADGQAENTLEKDTAMSGLLTYSPEYLRKHPALVKKLVASPDGTPGKEVAQRVQAAAPIIDAAVKNLKEWDRLHGKAAMVTKALAQNLAKLRTIYLDKNGRPDMRGQTQEYREAAALIYEKAGLEPAKASTAQAAVRYHLSDAVREILREDERFADGDEAKYLELCRYYRLNPETTVGRQKERRAVKSGRRRDDADAFLPALVVPDDDVTLMLKGAAEYAHKALEALPSDLDTEDLSDDVREAVREELEAVQVRVTELLDALGD